MNERVCFSKGNQKKFINYIREKSGLNWGELADKLKVNKNTLTKAYAFELCNIPYSLFKQLIKITEENESKTLKIFNAKIIEEIRIIGRKCMGKQKKKFNEINITFDNKDLVLDVSKVNYSLADIKKKIKLPNKLTPELAEEIGMHYGDGFLSAKRYDYRLKGNINDEIEYYKNYIKPLFKKLFNIDVNLKKFDSTFGFEVTSKALWEFKTKVIGIKSGNKRDLRIPEILKVKNQKILCAFIRGLFDTDGSLYFKSRYGYKNYYPTTTISLYSKNLIMEVGEILRMLGFNPSVYLNDNYPRISLNGIGSLKRYEKMIGWSSQKNLNKLKDWKNRYSQLNNMADVAQRQCARLWLVRPGFDPQLPLSHKRGKMNKTLNILFVCKYNRFRSRIAEAYFKKINKNKNIKVKSAGAIKGNPTNKEVISLAKKFGLDIRGKPRGLSSKLLIWQDIVVIVANDVPPSLINNKKYSKKTIVWKIVDVQSYNKRVIEKTIETIIKKVNKLNKKLEQKR